MGKQSAARVERIRIRSFGMSRKMINDRLATPSTSTHLNFLGSVLSPINVRETLAHSEAISPNVMRGATPAHAPMQAQRLFSRFCRLEGPLTKSHGIEKTVYFDGLSFLSYNSRRRDKTRLDLHIYRLSHFLFSLILTPTASSTSAWVPPHLPPYPVPVSVPIPGARLFRRKGLFLTSSTQQ